MPLVRSRLDPANPPRLSPETEARLDALSPEVIEQNALTDPDNPPGSEDELERARLAYEVRQVRSRTGLSQGRFAEIYRINPARLRDWEQGRFPPDSVAQAYLKVIDAAPELVSNILGKISDGASVA